MYHAMFSPHMVVHLVGQQQHHQYHHTNYSDSNNNNNNNNHQNHILTNNYYNHPFEHPYPLELLRLMGLEMPPIRSRGYNHHPSGGRGGGWRDRGSLHGSTLMPPPVPLGFRPIIHNSMKRNYWNKTNGRPPRSAQRDPITGNSDGAYNSSSDSGFSSRSPTPSKQQLHQSTHSDVSILDVTGGDKCEDIQTNISSIDNKGVKRLHEVYGTPTHSNVIGNGHHQQIQPQQQFYQQQSTPQQSLQDFSGLQLYQQHQNLQSGLIRSESPYQNKRRYHSGRHSPPPAVSHPHRPARGGRRINGVILPYSSGVGPPNYIAPDRFLSRAHLMQVTHTPPQLASGSEWDKLSQGIWNKFMKHQQTEETYKKKMLLWKYLYIFIRSSFPRYGLYLVGSTMNGFGSDSSDVDMCLLVRHAEMDQRNEAVGHLEQILKYLRRCEYIEQPELIQAKVPILKFRETRYCLEIDLNCNNAVGIRNTHLLYCYSKMDWRVRPLVLIIKLWAHKHNINDAKNMTISSYSLVLMVIHFLQCGVTPPVLPCLHRLYQGKFTPHSDIQMIDIHEELRPFNSDNTQTLGELLHDFLCYYVEFDFSQYAISVRLASRISIEECRRARTYKNDPHQWKYLCIEEPFDLTNTARSVYDRVVFERVKAVFHASYINLKKTRDIESIFQLSEKD